MCSWASTVICLTPVSPEMWAERCSVAASPGHSRTSSPICWGSPSVLPGSLPVQLAGFYFADFFLMKVAMPWFLMEENPAALPAECPLASQVAGAG